MLFLSILIPFHLCVCTPIKNGAAGTCSMCSPGLQRCLICNQNYFPNEAGDCQKECVEVSGPIIGTCKVCDPINNRCNYCNDESNNEADIYFPDEQGICLYACTEVQNGMPGTCAKCVDRKSCEICNAGYIKDDAGKCYACDDNLIYSYTKNECVSPCTIGNGKGECKTCDTNNPEICGSCNEGNSLIDGECISSYEVEITGDAVIGSELLAEISPPEAANYVSYQWMIDGEPIVDETTKSLIIKKEYFGKIISVNVIGDSSSDYPGNIEIKLESKVEGIECLPDVLQCSSCELDQTTCLECKIGQSINECKSCSETDRGKCAECNGNAALNEEGKCVVEIEVELIGESIVGSKLFAVVNPQDATNYVSYQWNADGESIVEGTTRTLLLKKEYFGKMISVNVIGDSSSVYQCNIEIDSGSKVEGKECLPNVLQCSACDFDQTTCIECKIGRGIDECKSCSETDRGKCSECNGNAILNEEGKCISKIEVEIIGEAVVGSVLTAQINPPEAADYVSYQWNAGGEPISGETMQTLLLTKSHFKNTISVDVQITDTNIPLSGNAANELQSTIEGTVCSSDVLQCKYCDSDQKTCLECLVGSNIDECATCSITEPNYCGSCNDEATLINGKCQTQIKVEIIGDITVGSKLVAQVYPLSAANFVSFQWKAEKIPLSGETTETLSLTSDLSKKKISVEVKPLNSNGAYQGVGTSKTKSISPKELKPSTYCIMGLIIGLILKYSLQ